MEADFYRSLDDIVETIQFAKAQKRGCCLLIGAGCSVSAGIPTAAGLVKKIHKRWPKAYDRAPEKTYFRCMEQVVRGQRRDLIAEYVDRAKINWAHIGIALLVKEGYVDRILTTNFDPLVLRACALLGEFPAVYDFAASQLLKTADIPDKAVFHLHGQRTGFILIIDEEEANQQFQRLGPVFEEALQGRVLIVAGYSGENDPVFNRLAEVECFEQGLFWVGYQDTEPASHIREKLLASGKDAFYVKGFDADSFFVSLATKLRIFPPDLIARPFTHLDCTLGLLTPFIIYGRDVAKNVTDIRRKWIREAIEEYEKRPAKAASFELAPADVQDYSNSLAAAAQDRYMAGDYEGVVSLLPKYQEAPSPELADPLAWAFIMLGNALSDQAQTRSGEKADRLLQLAGDKYRAALQVKPDSYEALYNWGLALDDQGRKLLKSGKKADRLLQLAGDKYQAALEIRPDDYDTLNNWGLILADQARTRSGDEADRLFQLASEKFQVALKIKPSKYDVLYNWGLSLFDQARTKSGDEADNFFKQSFKKLSRAEEIIPGSCSYNLACLSALRGDLEGCRTWLEKAPQYGTLPDLFYLQCDSDLESVREQAWFQDFLKSLS
jgi:tetratricopeptide (TPR) repeat protein